MLTLTPKTYNFNSVKGITQKQLAEHYKLYEGYVKKVTELDKINKLSDCFRDSNSTFSCMRSVKLGESFALNGTLLHQLYFENITDPSGAPNTKIVKLINSQWNGLKNFMQYLKNACLSMRGWVVVCFDNLTNSLRVMGLDAHDIGPLWCAIPIVVIDVYEHAYFLDFGTNRSVYIDTIFKNLNWKVINSRLDNLKL